MSPMPSTALRQPVEQRVLKVLWVQHKVLPRQHHLFRVVQVCFPERYSPMYFREQVDQTNAAGDNSWIVRAPLLRPWRARRSQNTRCLFRQDDLTVNLHQLRLTRSHSSYLNDEMVHPAHHLRSVLSRQQKRSAQR
jgi:hypothetical protein